MSGGVTLMIAAVAGALLYGRWRQQVARAVAERWLLRHRYHVRELRTPILARRPSFPLHLGRDSRHAVDLRAVVDDRKLGGTGVVWLRVWPDWAGHVGDEPEIAWERMPSPEAADAPPGGMPWEAAQLALLRRIADGEHAFRCSARGREPDPAFDRLVEHLGAMSRRGLITMHTPIADLRVPGQQYVAVTGVALTAEGARLVADA